MPGYLSLALERSHAFDADVRISCVPPCACPPTLYSTDSKRDRRRYTYIKRSEPAWLVPAHGRCDVELRVVRFSRGKVALKAATLAAPLPGNASVNTDTLYHLGYERPVVLTDEALQREAIQ